ncbi:hypothetical protein C2L64_20450 [Paraburkholderia hospita]|uniref:Uncharacterized protein n=3 Tax=Paraburkholderia hospita TaxID=169430 RepID=A0AAN1MKV8_9BURK|nr:hypothetical protein C2L64_20450 [Paraburkholderia hospita]OUL93376.1 hypothetical protein CA603_12680 [Paraburkholderia hospita]
MLTSCLKNKSPELPRRPSEATTQAAQTAAEIAMWTCRNCNARFSFNQVEAQIDESGFFFICRDCDYRNNLVNMGPDAAGRPQLIQRDDK